MTYTKKVTKIEEVVIRPSEVYKKYDLDREAIRILLRNNSFKIIDFRPARDGETILYAQPASPTLYAFGSPLKITDPRFIVQPITPDPDPTGIDAAWE